MCLDATQLPPLKKLRTTAKLVVNPLLVDNELLELLKKQVLTESNPFYLSAGFDSGTNFDFSNVISKIPIVCVTKSNPIPFNKYIYLLHKCKAVVLRRNYNPASSDLTGNTTVIEALAAEKPVIINDQTWLKALKEPNIHVYKDDADLERMLLQNNLTWKPTKNNYTIQKYLRNLKKILELE